MPVSTQTMLPKQVPSTVALSTEAFHVPLAERGLLPPSFSLENHSNRTLAQMREKPTGLDRYIFLSGLKGRDPALFYHLLLANMPVCHHSIFTARSRDACVNYSRIWRRAEGLYVSIHDKGRIEQVLRNWPGGNNGRIAVVTDGSRILGLGDLGANGLPIAIGKLDLYIAGAGVRPASTLPICLDLGTNTERYLNDTFYLGARQHRPSDREMEAFMDEFMAAMANVFPQLLVQFEDFSTDNAFKYLNRYRSTYKVFNDDIQGTGSVVLSGFINAARIASAASGLPLAEHRILFFGAGSAGIGVAKQLLSFFKTQGVDEETAKRQIWTVDSKGLIVAGRPGLQNHKHFFARTDYNGPALTQLLDVIDHVKPTALLGLSTIKGAFSKPIIEKMAAINKRPIIFPLSNPVDLCEVTFQDAVEWTDGRVVFASGSPYKNVEYKGNKFEPGQGNNMYIFPALGLGTIISKAVNVTDSMVEQAAVALSNSLTPEEHADGLIYPRLNRIRQVSATIASAVVRAAQKDGVDRNLAFREVSDATLLELIKAKMWLPSTSKTRF
ncbi:malate dehydrogenase [Hysterangium stoloniferum]|nr:malate dehydrogenase [Hysterangium stoloniferum]